MNIFIRFRRSTRGRSKLLLARPKSDEASVFISSSFHSVDYDGFVASNPGGSRDHIMAYKAFKLISSGRLTCDGRLVVHRVVLLSSLEMRDRKVYPPQERVRWQVALDQ